MNGGLQICVGFMWNYWTCFHDSIHTILMITFIVRGNISVHVIKDDTEKETEDKEI